MPAVVHAPRTYTIPKSAGGTRLMAELEPPDALRWADLGGRAAPMIERSLGPEVIANRVGAAFPAALRRARAASRRLVPPGEAVLRTDVAAFYPSVTARVLEQALRAVGVAPEDSRSAAALVEGWSCSGVPGLPVGPAPSAVMANAVLAPVDAGLRALGVPFVRWVDDYFIGVDEERGASVLDAFDASLEGLGLARHPRKTRLEPSGASPWLGALSRS